MTLKVTGGVYIDYGCNAVVPIGRGIFIPTDSQTSDSEKGFQKELEIFLNKWFCGCEPSTVNQTSRSD